MPAVILPGKSGRKAARARRTRFRLLLLLALACAGGLYLYLRREEGGYREPFAPAFDRLHDAKLANAAATGDKTTVLDMLAQHANPNSASSQKDTVLMNVVNVIGDIETVQQILRYGAKADARRPDGSNALYNCDDPTIVRLLCEAGADPNAEVNHMDSPLAILLRNPRGKYDAVPVLLDFGANPNSPAPNGVTPLMNACAHASPEIVSALLLHGADARGKDRSGQTALHYADENLYPPYRATMARMLRNAAK